MLKSLYLFKFLHVKLIYIFILFALITSSYWLQNKKIPSSGSYSSLNKVDIQQEKKCRLLASDTAVAFWLFIDAPSSASYQTSFTFTPPCLTKKDPFRFKHPVLLHLDEVSQLLESYNSSLLEANQIPLSLKTCELERAGLKTSNFFFLNLELQESVK